MLSREYDFKESRIKKGGSIVMEGVPKHMFNCLIQYIYSDHFYIHRHDVDFFIQLLVYADYFIMPRLVDICSSYLKTFVNSKTVVDILLFALAHNAQQLQRYCINFIALNEKEVTESTSFLRFRQRASPSL
jgi:BTB/POZ domain